MRAFVLNCFLLLVTLALSSCMPVSQASSQPEMTIQVIVDGKTQQVQAKANDTVQQVLNARRIRLEGLDRVEPALDYVVTDGVTIRVIRVVEKFIVEQAAIPFQHQTIYNESLPKDKVVLLQKGQNGIQEITNRRVYEDGQEVSSQPMPVKRTVLVEPKPEIVMVGIQTPFSPVTIPGRIVYLRDGSVWLMEKTTANRRPVITTGDLDGRVFSLSADGSWLLFTRRSTDNTQINTLWAANLITDTQNLVDLKVANVIHFADWVPNSTSKITFSTVEPRSAAPGWQANNDLHALTFSSTGWTTKWSTILEPNMGGTYGWWGMSFLWESGGKFLAYARPDEFGLIDYLTGVQTPAASIIPLRTHGNWAWVPGLTFSPDSRTLYTVDHSTKAGLQSPEESPNFDLIAFSLDAGRSMRLVSNTGMFAYPLASPSQAESSGENAFQVAYLQAAFPGQSETSRYQIALMDRDGSDQRIIFPAAGTPGLEPKQHWGAWSPNIMPESGNFSLLVIYQGNIWLVDSVTGNGTQVTGDSLTTRVAWR